MAKVVLLKGLPASGKSTWAKEEALKPKTKRINKDDLRAMLDNSKFSGPNEKLVLEVRDYLVRLFLGRDMNVLVDDTNLDPSHEKTLKEIAKSLKADFEVKFFDVSLQECINRDRGRGERSVGEKVIRKMYQKYLQKSFARIPFDATLPMALMVDIDGTIAHGYHRSPYDSSKYHLDVLDNLIPPLVARYRPTHKILLCSGRHETYREATEAWLKANDFEYDLLLMRRAEDMRNDSIIKVELFDEHIRAKYNVEFVIDDRPRVISAWQRIGLRTLACNTDYYNDF